MDNKRRNLFLLAIVVITALPATSAYLLYKVTKNPTLRPLGITQEALAKQAGQVNSVAIEIDVAWGTDRAGGATQDEMDQFISTIMSSHTEDFVINFIDVPGADMDITLHVGHNRYGPFSPGQLAEGMRLALAALTMTKQANG